MLRRIKGWPAGDYAGMTCAACHEGQLKYKGKLIRIEGGISNTFDFQALAYGIGEALQATLTDAAKFDRLASRIGASNPDAKANCASDLRARVRGCTSMSHPNFGDPAPMGPWPDGCPYHDRRPHDGHAEPEFARTGQPAMRRSSLRSSGMHRKGLWTQWRAFAQDPIDRNFDETMGVLPAH